MRDSIVHLHSHHLEEHAEEISFPDSDRTNHDEPDFTERLEDLRSIYDSADTIHCNEDLPGKVTPLSYLHHVYLLTPFLPRRLEIISTTSTCRSSGCARRTFA